MKTPFSSPSLVAMRALVISSLCLLLAAAVQTAQAQVVTLSATSLAFGTVVINTTSAAKKVTLRNTSASMVSVSVSLSGNFAQTNTCGGSLTAGATCVITVTFNPTATGSQTGAVTVSDSADSGSRAITLTGSGVVPVAASPALQAFGSVAVETTSAAKVFTVKNNQATATSVTISTSAPFAQTNTCGSGLGAGASCTINATFAPTATGLQKGSIAIAYTGMGSPLSVSVQGTGVLPITISPSSRAFSSVALGTTSAAKVFTVKNNQTAAASLTISTSAPFAQTNTCGVSLGAGASCTINATFAPTVTGLQTGSITIAYAGTGSPQSVSLTGTGVLPITISPTSRAFGSVVLGATSIPLAFTVKNNQTAAASVTISTSVPFAQTNTCGVSLGAEASCTINATFAPTVTGLQTGSITIAYAGVGSPQAVVLQGTGITPVTVSPTAVVFTNQHVGTASSPRTVSITNHQTAPMTINSIATSGVFGQTNTCGSSLAAAASCSVAVVFNPTVVGPASGTLTITDSATTSPQVLALSGTGTIGNIVSIVITAPNPSLASGSSEQLKATATYGNGTTGDITTSALWTSANPSIATVGNATGMATGVTAGSAKITAAVTGITVIGSLSLTVAGPTLQTIAVTPVNPSLAKGTNLALKATGTYSDGSTQDLTTQVAWSSSAGAVTVSNTAGSQGVVTGASVGSATVTAAASTSPSVSGSTKVTVTAATLQSIAANPPSPSVALGLKQQFTAIGTYSDTTTQDITGTVTWGSSNPSIATIGNGGGTHGQATTLAQGSTLITASLGSISGSTTLTVGAAVLVSMAVTPPSPSIALGTKQQFTAIGTYSDNGTQNMTTSVVWSSASGGVATISNLSGSNGMSTSTGEGTTTITATSGSTSGNTVLTVTAPALISITVSPAAISVHQGATQQFSATGSYSDSSTQDITASVAWSAGDGTVATVSNSAPQGGLATGVAGGAVQVVATFTPTAGPAISSSNTGGGGTLTIISLNSVTVAPSAPIISLGTATMQLFTASAAFADSTTSDVTASATWSSSATTVATISNTQGSQGQATLLTLGTTTITATYASMAGSTTLTITPATLESIAISPASVSLGLNATQQYTATGTYSDGSTSDLTSQVAWVSGDPTFVSISAGGLATVLGTSTSGISISASLTNGAGTLITSPPAWLSALSSLPIVCPTPTIDMKLLVINNAGQNYADFPAIQQILNYVGTPYDVADVSGTLPALSDGQCHGYYQGVIYAFGDDIYNNSAFYTALTSYEQTFHVRQLNWYTNPTPDFGFNDSQASITSSETDSGTFTAAAAPVFFYANLVTPVSFSNAFIYLTTPTTPSGGGTVTPLLMDPAGYTLSGITTFADGRQYLSQMFDSNPYLMHDLVLAYGLVNWVTQGVFLGDYHVYATQSVDDLFIDDSEWIPSTSCLANPLTEDRTPPDASNLPVFRVNSADMTQLATWQNAKQADPLLSQFKLTLAFNGVGTAGNGDWTGLTAPITFTSAVNGVGTISATDFAALPGQQVTVSGTTNGGGAFNGTFPILTVTSSAATTPGTTTFTVNLGNGVSATQQAETHHATASVPDDLVANLQSYQQYFHWISHTYNHPTTLNGLHKSDVYGDLVNNPPTDDIDLEVLTNLFVASGAKGLNLDNDPSDVGLKQLTFTDFNPSNMITPGVTGLNDTAGVPSYLNEDGIQYVVTDTSVTGQINNGPNPSPNVGIANSYATGIYEVPRHPNDIFYNVANWADDQAEFVCIYSYYVPPNSPPGTLPAPYPPFNTFSAAQILDFVSSSFVVNMLMGDMDPEMFHQPDLHFSDNYLSLSAAPVPAGLTGITSPHVSSLITDTYDQTFNKYEAVYNLPVLTPTLDQLGVLMQNRNSFNVSGVTASIVGAGTETPTITVTVPSSTTMPAVIPITGLNSVGAESYGGQHISHISMTPGQTITLPLK